MFLGGMDLRLRPYPSAAIAEPSVYDDAIALWKLDEASGTRADSIGSLDLTDNNTVGYKNLGPAGTVAEFTAANSESLSNTAIEAVTSVTVAGWVNFSDLSTSRGVFTLGSGSFAGTHLAAYGISVGKIRVSANGTPYEDKTVDSGTVAVGEWHFLVAQFNASTKKAGVSLDGGAVSESTALANSSVSSGDIFFGTLEGATFNQGDLARFGIWSRLLDAAEITSLYNSGKGKAYSDLTDDEKVGLVSYWNLDEASGDRADSHGSNTLTDNNTVTSATNSYPANLPGTVASFVEANFEYLSHVDDPTLRVGVDDFTFSFWYYPTEAELDIILNKGGQEDYTFDTNAGVMRFYFKNGGAYPTATWGSAPALNAWHHVIGWRSSADSAVYVQVDGGTPVSAATGTIVDSDTAGVFAIGAVNGGGFPLQGRMSTVAFWKRALTSDERAALYNSGDGAPLPA